MADSAANPADRRPPEAAGPVLFCRGVEHGRLHLAVLYAGPVDGQPPALEDDNGQAATAKPLLRGSRYIAWGYEFSLAAGNPGGYRFDGREFPVQGVAADGDLRIGFVACNGMETGELARPLAERNVLWQRLADDHGREPLALLLHGGDQIYADEMLDVHPAVQRWADLSQSFDADTAFDTEIEIALRDDLMARYVELYAQPAIAYLLACVPSLMMWDDHDICDGWGSLPVERLDAPIGRGVFGVARECFLAFQMAACADTLPACCADPQGRTLAWSVALPGVRVVAPDLRSERRPRRVMAEAGWQALDAILDDSGVERVLVLSSVPALGPRLSWVEAFMALVPKIQQYEDDLRDQWQSRAHREEWRRFLRRLLSVHERGDARVTVLSGEIHLATRAAMRAALGDLHQLVASGIAHPPPPRNYARCLGALARLGETPLPDNPIRLAPLPGQRAIYAAQRNYLVLERHHNRWQAYWELEDDGTTPRLTI